MFCFLGSKYKNIFPFPSFYVYPAISNSQDFCMFVHYFRNN